MALIDKLTAIAAAIRTKTGGTDALTLDQMVTEIEGIEVGGTIATGSFTVAEDYAVYEFEHALGKIPSLIILVPAYQFVSLGSTSGVFLAGIYVNGMCYGAYNMTDGVLSAGGEHDVTGPNSSYSDPNFLAAPFFENVTAEKITFIGAGGQRVVKLTANTEYRYYVG